MSKEQLSEFEMSYRKGYTDHKGHGGNMVGGNMASSINDATPAEWDAAAEKLRFSATIEAAPDMVDKPAHYHQGAIECIEYIRGQLTEEQFKGYLTGSLYKYVHRFQYKNGEEDLKKARWFLDKLLGEAQ